MIRNSDLLNYGVMPPENLNQDEIMILFLIDKSGSMAPYMSTVNEQINKVVDELKRDNLTSKMAEIAVMSFNDRAYLEQDFRPVTQMNEINLNADGGTELEKALLEGINIIKDRGHLLMDTYNMTIRVPFIFLVSDCDGGDVTRAAMIINERVSKHKLQLWTLGCGNYDKATMSKLHPDGIRIFEMKEGADVKEAYKEFFEKVVVGSIKQASSKGSTNPSTMEDIGNNPNSSLCIPSWVL